MAKKKILFLTHLYYPSLGGAERVFQRLAEGLADRGHEVTVLTSDALSTEQYYLRTKNSLPDEEKLNGVQVVRESITSGIYRLMRWVDAPLRRLGRAGVYLRPLSFGPHFLNSWKGGLRFSYHFVFSGPIPTSTVYYGLLYKARHPGARLVILPCLHIQDKLHTSPLNIMALKRADYVLALTRMEKEYLARRGVKKDKILVIGSGVDEFLLNYDPAKIQRTDIEREKDYILYLGQEGEHKRVPLLIKAMTRIWEMGYENLLVIAGARTNYSASIDRLVNSLPRCWQQKIYRLNNFPEETKARVIDNCLMMVNPSRYESFGLVFLEAWARAKPVIGADILVLRELIRPGENGLLFRKESVEDLTEKILLLLKNRELGFKLGKKGREELKQRYTWARIIDNLAETLRI